MAGAGPARPGDGGRRGGLLGQGVEQCWWKLVRGTTGVSKRDGGVINPRKHLYSSLLLQIDLFF